MITATDIERWLEDFNRAKRVIAHIDISEDDKNDLNGRINDGIYLTTLVESLMGLEEPDGVLERAYKRQGKARHEDRYDSTKLRFGV